MVHSFLFQRVVQLMDNVLPQNDQPSSITQPTNSNVINVTSNSNLNQSNPNNTQSSSPTKKRLALTRTELDVLRSQLAEERARRIRWERRAVVASADLAAIRDAGDPARLQRLLTIAEEQRDVALSRLATHTADVDGVHEQNRTLNGAVCRLELELAAARADLQLARGAWHDAILTTRDGIEDENNRESRLADQISFLIQQLQQVSDDRETLRERISILERDLANARIDTCELSIERVQGISIADRVDELETHQKESNRRYAVLEKDCDQLQLECDQYKEKLNESKTILEELTEKYSETTNKLKESQKQCEEIPVLRHENDKLNKIIESSQEEHKQLEENFRRIRDEFSSIVDDAEGLRVKNAKLREEIDILSNEESLLKRTKELENKLAEANSEKESVMDRLEKLQTEMSQEREKLLKQLSVRAAGIARMEAEFTDARQTYITAAQRFERERKLTRRMSASAAEGNRRPVLQLHERIVELERENAELKRSGMVSRRRLSSSSVSSEEDMMRKVAELEMSLEMESQAKKKAELKVNELMKKASEMEEMKNEMSNIHSKMRRMATVSLPRDTEQMLMSGEDEDAKRLAEIREQARLEEQKEGSRKKGEDENIKIKDGGAMNKLERSIDAHVKRFSQKRRVRIPGLDSNKPRFR